MDSELKNFMVEYHQTSYEESCSYMSFPQKIGTSLNPLEQGPKCPKCGKSYRWKGNLKRHLKFECGKMAQIQCPHCQYCAKRKCHLVKHILRKHPTEKK